MPAFTDPGADGSVVDLRSPAETFWFNLELDLCPHTAAFFLSLPQRSTEGCLSLALDLPAVDAERCLEYDLRSLTPGWNALEHDNLQCRVFRPALNIGGAWESVRG